MSCPIDSCTSARSGTDRHNRLLLVVSIRVHGVHEPGCTEQPFAEKASCDTSHPCIETCIVSPPRCRRLRQRYIRLCQVQPNLVFSCIGDSGLDTSCLHPTQHNFVHHTRQLTSSFHAGRRSVMGGSLPLPSVADTAMPRTVLCHEQLRRTLLYFAEKLQFVARVHHGRNDEQWLLVHAGESLLDVVQQHGFYRPDARVVVGSAQLRGRGNALSQMQLQLHARCKWLLCNAISACVPCCDPWHVATVA